MVWPRISTASLARASAKRRLFSSEGDAIPYYLLFTLLLFNSFRPDRLLPGGSITTHLPTVLVLVLAVYWIQAPRKCVGNRQTLYFFLLVVVSFVGALLARNKAWAFEQLRGFFLYIFLPYLFTVQFLDRPQTVQKYIRAYLFASLFFVLVGISRSGLVVNVPILSDENEFALLANILIPLAYFLGQDATAIRAKLLYFGVVIILIFATVTSFSRGGLVGLAAVGAFIFFFTKRKSVAIVLLALFCTGLIAFASESYWADMETMFSEKGERGTGRDRLESWKAGWQMFLDHPVVGVGPRNFGMYLADYYTGWEARAPRHMWGRVAHSVYFTVIPETGILGTGLFVMILLSNYRDNAHTGALNRRAARLALNDRGNQSVEHDPLRHLRSLRSLSVGLMGSMVAFLVTGLFISVFWYPYIWMLTAFMVITANAARRIELAMKVSEGSRLRRGDR
jgi:hypothetical protein